MSDKESNKPVVWIGSSLVDLKDFPATVQSDIGYALYFAQDGIKHSSAKPLKGFKGARVLEIVENHRKTAVKPCAFRPGISGVRVDDSA
jgi:phage-related protein